MIGDPNFNAWIRNNHMVISWILNSISKEISTSVIYSKWAHKIWIDLKERYQQSNGPCIFQLRRELMNVNQGHLSISSYFTKLKIIWDELSNYRSMCSCGKCTRRGSKALVEHYHIKYAMSFFMGLNESFAHVKGQLFLMDPISSINKVFALISQEEHQWNIVYLCWTWINSLFCEAWWK